LLLVVPVETLAKGAHRTCVYVHQKREFCLIEIWGGFTRGSRLAYYPGPRSSFFLYWLLKSVEQTGAVMLPGFVG